MRRVFSIVFLICLVFIAQLSIINVGIQATTSAKIAFVHANYLVMLSDELTYLKTLDASRYSYDEYTEDNIDNLWADIDNYKAILLDEDCIYSWQTGARLPLYYSFYNHKTSLDQWVWNGGGLFITDNNDLYNIAFTPYRLTWDWLPESLHVTSIDIGKDASGGNLKIVDKTHWLFTTPNILDDNYINDPSRGHAHGYFITSECPGYSTLMVRTDAGYENQPVEIFKNYGVGVAVLSHAELEDGYSWKYVQNEIDNVLLSPREQLINSLNMLNRTVCELIVENTRTVAKMRSDSIGVLDPNHFGLAFDMVKLAVSILIAATANYQVYSTLTSDEVQALSLANAYVRGTASGLTWVNIGFSGFYKAKDTLLKPDENYDWNLVFKDKEAQLITSDESRITHYFEILLGKKEDGTEIWPRHGIYDGQTLFYGVDDILSHAVEQYNNFVSSLPSTLPSSFDWYYTMSYLNDLRRSVRDAMTTQTTVNFYDATHKKGSVVELGGTKALEKSLEFSIKEFQSAKLWNNIQWAATAIWNCIKLAVGIPTAGTGTLALLAFNVIVGALNFLKSQENQEIQMRSRDLVIQDLIRSMAVLDTEAVICKDILSETTKFVSELIAASEVGTPLVEITDVNIPDVSTKQTFGGGFGDVEVHNLGSTDAFVTLFITFYAAPQKTNIWLKMVDAGVVQKNSKASVHFTFDLPKTEIFGCEQYYADIKAYSVSDLGIYLTDHFTPTPSFYVGDNCGCQVKDIANQNVAQGETRSLTYTSSGKSTRFVLWYKGSSMNLHLYDSQGNHVGINYYSGKIENEIPNAQYSGPDQIPEWIYVSDSTNKSYTLNVVGVDLPQPENFTVTATEIPVLPALLTQIPSKVQEEAFPGDVAEFPIAFIEYGGQRGFANITLKPSTLTSNSGNNIAYNKIRFSDNSFNLQPSSSKTVTATISVPNDVRNGLFTGQIEVLGTGATIPMPVEIQVAGYPIRFSNNPSDGGSITINETSYAVPTNASYAGTWALTATASNDYVFDHWAASQNITVNESTSTTTNVTFKGPGTLQAVYVPRQKGLPLWLVAAVLVAIVASSTSILIVHRRKTKKTRSRAALQTPSPSIVSMRICQHCRSANRPNAKFCGKCGKPL